MTSSIIFSDVPMARDTLSTLSSMKYITAAAIYDTKGSIFATYEKENNGVQFRPIAPKAPGFNYGLNYVELYEHIFFENQFLGTIYIKSDLNRFYSRIKTFVFSVFIITIISFGLSYLLFTLLRKPITEPITNLTRLMRYISKERDYSKRIELSTEDEIAYLAQGFNDMLETIERHRKELEHYQKNLEELVTQRTVELMKKNVELSKELAERIRIEKALAESEDTYHTIFETTGNASLIIDEDTTIITANKAAEELFGISKEELEGKKSWTEFVSREDLERMKKYHYDRRIDPSSVTKQYEATFIDRYGNKKNVLVVANIIPGTVKSIATIIDITERKRLEEQLLQSQKMEAIGTLAGGVAHNFNNLLTVILGYGELIKYKVKNDDVLNRYLDSIISSAEKGKRLTQGLLAFSRKQMSNPKPIDLNEVISDSEKILKRLIGEDIILEARLAETDIIVLADHGQIEQILINLVTNARDAMPRGGFINIETSLFYMDEDFIAGHGYGKKGYYGVITVSDTGSGIEEKYMERIFEPFFTTKEVGKGTGLGLSIVYGAVKQNKGYLDVKSEVNKGTTFRIYLPLIESAPIPQKKQTAEVPCGEGETILVAEDDESLRLLIKTILEQNNYKVLTATDGEDALKIFYEKNKEINLVMLDVIMPRMNGKEAYDRIKEVSPDTPALFISGYTAEFIRSKDIGIKEVELIQKPVLPQELLKKVRSILKT